MLASLAVFAGTTIAVRAEVKAVFSEKGLASLAEEGTEWLADGVPAVLSVTTESRTRNDKGYDEEVFEAAPLDGVEPRFDAAKREALFAYPWGSIAVAYRPGADRLGLAVTVSNRGERPIVDFRLRLLRLRFPEPAAGWDKPSRHVVRSLDCVAAVPAVCGGRRVVACLDTLFPPLAVGYGSPENPERTIHAVELGAGVPAADPDAPRIPVLGLARVAPGEERTFEVSLRFAPADKPLAEIIGDLHAGFRKAFPPLNDWPDRRPIGMLMLHSGGRSERNPRGWFKKPELDIATPEGKAEFRTLLMDYAARAVASLKAFDAQGGIVWNIEGEENPHPITYIGDPRLLPILAPEMDAVADEFFKQFTDAGLKVGVTIRPTQVYFDEGKKAWSHGTGSHMPERNPLSEDYGALAVEGLPPWCFFPSAERLCRKIEYAKKRWGCTIFYIDTNGVYCPQGPKAAFEWMLLNGCVLRRVKERHPDVLLIPELNRDSLASHDTNWAYGAQYMELDLNGYGTPPGIRQLYPNAFSLVNIADGPIEEKRDVLVQAVRNGDILMARGWFADGRNAIVKSIYEEAAATPPAP